VEIHDNRQHQASYAAGKARVKLAEIKEEQEAKKRKAEKDKKAKEETIDLANDDDEVIEPNTPDNQEQKIKEKNVDNPDDEGEISETDDDEATQEREEKEEEKTSYPSRSDVRFKAYKDTCSCSFRCKPDTCDCFCETCTQSHNLFIEYMGSDKLVESPGCDCKTCMLACDCKCTLPEGTCRGCERRHGFLQYKLHKLYCTSQDMDISVVCKSGCMNKPLTKDQLDCGIEYHNFFFPANS
jgi:hypothetical protein